MPQPAARFSDQHVCSMVTGFLPHFGGPVVYGCETVLIGGEPAARLGDLAVCEGPTSAILSGSETVFIEGAPAARVADPTDHGGEIISGLATVLIGP